MGEINVESRTLFIADNLEILRGINSESIDLIATDPPFNKGVKAFEGIVTAGLDEEGKKVRYKDVWTWGDVQSEWTESIRQDHPNLYAVVRGANTAAGDDMGAYLCWLGVRVLEMHRVLKAAGSIYIHVDDTAHAYVKAMLDAIFGRANFRNAIVWRRYGSHNDARNYGRVYDVLLYYVKENVGVWNRAYSDLDPIYVEKTYRLSDERGRYRTAPLHTGGLSGGGYEYEFRGFTRTWRYPKERMEELERNNLIRQARKGEGIPERKVYLEDSKGIPLSNLWDDIGALTGNHNERTGYPTQKPLALYERIIKASSNEGDIVLDPFAGCATTCVAAERLGRGWIGIDLNEPARKVIRDRLKREINKSMAWGKLVKTPSQPPMRTDGGQEAAPELILVSPKPKAPRLSARELRGRLVIADGLKCQGCGWVPHHEEYMEVDHRVPKSRGGRDDLRNRVLLCGPCNGTKGNKLTLAELRRRRLDEGRMEDKSWDEEWYEREGRFG